MSDLVPTKKNKGGRPRGPDYEKNLAKRQRLERQRNEQGQRYQADAHLTYLAKSVYSLLQKESVASREPYFSVGETSLVANGVMLRHPTRIPLDILRKASYSTSLIGAIHNIRVDDISDFACRDHMRVILKEEGDKEDEALIKEGLDLLENFGRFDKEEWRGVPKSMRGDRVHTVMEMMARDALSIDRLAFHVTRNRVGSIQQIRYLDPATIWPTDATGYKGDRSITHVQVIDNAVVAIFKRGEILLRHKVELSDVRYRGTGLSPTEICIMELVGITNALKYNRERFSNNPPKGFVAVESDISEEMLERLNERWNAMFQDGNNHFEIPVIGTGGGKATWNPLGISDEMAFDRLMQWYTTFVIACHGMDQAELGLRLLASQTLSEGNGDGKQEKSSSRAKRGMLSFFADVFNDLLEMDGGTFDGYSFKFDGVDPKDENAKADLAKKQVTSVMTVDEVREEMGKETLGEELIKRYKVTDPEEKKKLIRAGGMILDSTWKEMGWKMVDPAPPPEQPGLGDSDDYDDYDDPEDVADDDPWTFDDDGEEIDLDVE